MRRLIFKRKVKTKLAAKLPANQPAPAALVAQLRFVTAREINRQRDDDGKADEDADDEVPAIHKYSPSRISSISSTTSRGSPFSRRNVPSASPVRAIRASNGAVSDDVEAAVPTRCRRGRQRAAKTRD